MISYKEYDKLNEFLATYFQAIELWNENQNPQISGMLSNGLMNIENVLMQYMESIPIDEPDFFRAIDELGCAIKENKDKNIIHVLINECEAEFEKVNAGDNVPSNLYKENNIERYFDMLYGAMKEGLTILISAYGTPCGHNNFSEDLGEKLQNLGLAENLAKHKRKSYIGIIDNKMVIDEQVSENIIEATHVLDGCVFYLKSVGESVQDQVNICNIRINGYELRAGNLGLNIVVYDRKKQQLVDSVNFYMNDKILRGNHLIDSRERKFIESHPEVSFFKIDKPEFVVKNKTNYEEFIAENPLPIQYLHRFPVVAYSILQSIPYLEGVREVLTQPDMYRSFDGSRKFFDKKGKYVNCVNGYRLTSNQPREYKRCIYILGGCIELGIGVSDSHTYASILQNILNRDVPEKGFKVINCGMGCTGISKIDEMLKTVKTLPLKKDDIVIGLGEKIRPYNREYDIRPSKYGEVFFDGIHLVEGGHRLVADEIYETLIENDFFDSNSKIQSSYDLSNNGSKLEKNKKASGNNKFEKTPEYMEMTKSPELEKYKNSLRKIWKEELNESENVGAIVMNCNPFTMGHRYLIEEARKECEYLIIFVVQEDKSYFPFADRIKLVLDGVKDLPNVIVIPSGQFIISMETFKGYFNKRELQNRVIDSSNDVLIFANEIAPAAHIKVRFAGSEPIDKVTDSYNRTMEKILPQFGVKFVEISRKNIGDRPISASRVRELLEEDCIDEIAELVPNTTMDYLKNFKK